MRDRAIELIGWLTIHTDPNGTLPSVYHARFKELATEFFHAVNGLDVLPAGDAWNAWRRFCQMMGWDQWDTDGYLMLLGTPGVGRVLRHCPPEVAYDSSKLAGIRKSLEVMAGTAAGTLRETDADGGEDNEEALLRMTALMDNTQAKIVRIATKNDLTIDQKLRAIAALDDRFCGKSSVELATLLNCTPQAIRLSDWWKASRQLARE